MRFRTMSILFLSFIFLAFSGFAYKPPGIGYIYIGDSRYVGQDTATKMSDEENTFVIAEVGKGYNWLTGGVEGQIEAIKQSHNEVEIWYEIYNLGINDLGNIEKYCGFYEKRAEENNLIFVSINPVYNYKTISNEQVESFNERIKELDLPYIDTYWYLSWYGFSTTDGVHFTNDTYKDIHRYTVSVLGTYLANKGEKDG